MRSLKKIKDSLKIKQHVDFFIMKNLLTEKKGDYSWFDVHINHPSYNKETCCICPNSDEAVRWLIEQKVYPELYPSDGSFCGWRGMVIYTERFDDGTAVTVMDPEDTLYQDYDSCMEGTILKCLERIKNNKNKNEKDMGSD